MLPVLSVPADAILVEGQTEVVLVASTSDVLMQGSWSRSEYSVRVSVAGAHLGHSILQP